MPVPVLVSVTVAPGRIAPLLSVTVPRTSAVFACATTREAQAARANKTRRVAATTVLVPEQTACRPVLALIHTHVFVIAAVPPFQSLWQLHTFELSCWACPPIAPVQHSQARV